VVVATVVGFLGSAFGTVGGVGGGGIFVPMLNLVVGFDTKSAAALSKCMIMGASASSVWYNLQVSHPTKEAPVIDYKLALLFQPMLMLGITRRRAQRHLPILANHCPHYNPLRRHLVEILLQGHSDVEGGVQDSDGDTRARRAIQVYLRCK